MLIVVDALAAFGGIASCDELAACGFSLRAIDHAVAAGAVTRVRRGWAALPSAPPSTVSAVQAGGTVTCVSLLRRLGVWTEKTPLAEMLHVRIGRYGKVRDPTAKGIHLHRAWPIDGLAPPRGGVDSIESALVHATMCQGRFDAIVSLESAVFEKVVTGARVFELLAQLPGSYSSFAEALRPAQSGLETRTRLGLRAASIHCQSQVQIAGVGHVDLLIGDRLVIETDGRTFHSNPQSFSEDKRRDLALADEGYLVIRLSYEQVMYQWEHVLKVIRGLMARGEHRWAGRHRRGGLVHL